MEKRTREITGIAHLPCCCICPRDMCFTAASLLLVVYTITVWKIRKKNKNMTVLSNEKMIM